MKKGAWKTSTAELLSYITKSPERKSIRRFTRNKKDSSINSTTLTLMLYCWQHWNILRLTTLKYSPIDHNLISNLETMGFKIEISGRLFSVIVPLTMAVGWIHIMFVGKLENVFLVRRFWKRQTSSTGKYCRGAKGKRWCWRWTS